MHYQNCDGINFKGTVRKALAGTTSHVNPSAIDDTALEGS